MSRFAAISTLVLLLFVFANQTLAFVEDDATQVGTSTFRFDSSVDLDDTAGVDVGFAVFNASIPSRTATTTSVVQPSNYAFPLYFIITANYAACSSNLTDSFTCDLETLVGGVDGSYWVLLYANNYPGGEYTHGWGNFLRSNGVWTYASNGSFPVANPDLQTRFTGMTITGTSTVAINAGWFVDSEEYNSTIAEFNPTQVKYSYSYGTTTDISSRSETMSGVPGTGTTTTYLSGLQDGYYDVIAQFSNQGVAFGGPTPFRSAYVNTRFYIAGGVLTGYDTVEIYDYSSFADEAQYQPCSLTELAGCLSNAGRFLFIPTDTELNNFFATASSLQSRFPFAYAYDFYSVSATLFTSSSTQNLALTLPFGDLGSTTIISTAQLQAVPFASTVKSIIAALLWLMFALLASQRVQSIFNRQ